MSATLVTRATSSLSSEAGGRTPKAFDARVAAARRIRRLVGVGVITMLDRTA